MRDDGTPSTPPPQKAAAALSKPSKVTASTTGTNLNTAPPGHSLRRTKTVDDGQHMRRKSWARSEGSFEGDSLHRRSSNFSETSLNEARDILNPRAHASHEVPPMETSSLASLSLAFALLPAIAGILFKNGHSVVTDVMLLGLSGVFLHWSVTQPWVWYHAAQQVRIHHEADAEVAVEDDSDSDSYSSTHAGHRTTNLDDVPEEEEALSKQNGSTKSRERKSHNAASATPQQRAALRELYTHEILALLSCFALPLVSAYLLHYIRAQLSRPSEGLVSNYNLTIFLLVSELRAFSHALKLVQSRTLHLQRVIHGNPYASPTQTGARIEEMMERLTRLEARSLADEFVRTQTDSLSSVTTQDKTTVTRDVRNAIQPELDALNRAVRRYEKKATLLQYQTDARFASLDARLEDTIALAAVAAKNSSSKNMFVRAMESMVTIVLFPFNSLLQMAMLPLRSILGLISLSKKQPSAAKHGRQTRTGKHPTQTRYNGGDRVTTRVMKR